MARPWRIQFPGACYHVMARGNDRRDIFRDDGDRQGFLAILGDAASRFQLEILAFCLMNNHYHLFLRTPEPNLSRAMHRLNAVYTQRFNRRHRRRGHLLEGRFKAVLVTDESHWHHLSHYLHLNPVRAGLVEDPADWEWSSFRDYTRARVRWPWLRPEAVRGEDAAARRKYRAEALGLIGSPASIWRELRESVFLGARQDWDRLRRERPPAGSSREVPDFAARDRGRERFEEELARVAAAFKIDQDAVLGRAHIGPARGAAYYHLVERCGFPPSEIASYCGRSPSAISLGIKRFKQTWLKKRSVLEVLNAKM